MKLIQKPAYTVYNDPAYVKFISEYFQQPNHLLKIESKRGSLIKLPFIRVKRKYVCLPFASAVGIPSLPAGENESHMQDVIASGMPGGSWEIRSFMPLSKHAHAGKCIPWLNLRPEKEEMFAAFSSNLRRKIRKARKNCIQVVSGHEELASDFYHVYSSNCTRLGSAVLRKDFYAKMLTAYKEKGSCFFVAYWKSKAIGASLLLGSRDQWECIYFGSIQKYNKLYTAYLLVWEMIGHAIQNNGAGFSFGRNDIDSGVHQFKKQWGTFDIPVYWNYSHPVKFEVRKYKRLAAAFWPYTPKIIRKIAGPAIAKRIY